MGLLVEATGVKETGCLDSTKRGLQPALEDLEQLHVSANSRINAEQA